LASASLQFAVVAVPLSRDLFEAKLDVAREWWLVGLLALTPVTAVELFKMVKNRWWPEEGAAVSENSTSR
jgi:hypothetical protein